MRTLTAGVLVALAGCSVLITERLPDDHRPGRSVECTTGDDSAWGDLLWALPLATVAYLERDNSAGLPFVLWSGTHLLSAAAGFYWHASCRHAVSAHDTWLRSHPVPVAAKLGVLSLLGRDGQACFPNHSCMSLLVCERATNRCRIAPERGAAGGECYPNQTCDLGAHCDLATTQCAAGSIGSAGAPCYRNHTCDAGLSCGANGCAAP